ncbi:MAG TPA: HK97 gp10 family phage protein [Solidesulfovibrio magneticus]|nr:HK97 gp10 family phage protein [Solidesulfovibrio magneticus]
MALFSDCFDQVMDSLEEAMEAELQEEVLPEAQALVPVRTGKLKASIAAGTERDGIVITGYVEAGVKYAPYVEFGTKDRAAKPFLRPAVEKFDLARVADRMKGGGE